MSSTNPSPAPNPNRAADPDRPLPSIPVICDQCRATGVAGDESFAAIPDLLEFEPVPRRARANGWTPEHQRAFIAALAITGSPRQAARHVGRAQFGAEQLRTARGGRSFAAAWQAALDLARDRELARLHGNLGDLARRTEEANAQIADGRYILADPTAVEEDLLEREHDERQERIRNRLLAARRLYLFEIGDDPASRAAWETLCGPVDWDRAELLQPQDNEPYAPSMRAPDMLLAAEHQWLAEMTGGPSKTKVLQQGAEQAAAAEREDGE
jgi:hypothetical protein